MAVRVQHYLKFSGLITAYAVFLTPYCSFAQRDTTKKLKQVDVNSRSIPRIQSIAPVQSVTSNEFARYSAITVADVVSDFAGVIVKDYGGIGGLKTVSVRGFGADHTGVMYDGIVIDDAENGQLDVSKINLNGISEVALYNAQPGDILNPAKTFASASMLSIKTVRPHLTPDKSYQVLLGANAGSFGLINPYFAWQQRLSDKWSFIINGYTENANGRYTYKATGTGNDSTQTRTNTDVSAQQIDGALYWSKNDSNKFVLHIDYYNSNNGVPGAVIYYNPVSHQRLWNDNFFTQASYEHTWDNGLQLLLNTKLTRLYTRYRDPDYLNNTGGIDEHYTQREAYQSGALAYHITNNWEASYAADIAFADLNIVSPTNSVYKFAFPSRFTLQDVVATRLVLNKWHFSADLLHTYVNEWVKLGTATPQQNELSPTVMAAFWPNNKQDLQIRAFYKDIFREPTFGEQYLFSLNGSRNLKPEFAKQYDLGTTFRKAFDNFLDYLLLDVDGYYNTVSNKIVAVPNQNPVISTIYNLGHVRIEGLTAMLQSRTHQYNGWSGAFSLSYTYQYAVDDDANTPYYLQQIPYTPKNTLAFNAGLIYKNAALFFNQVLSSSRYYLGQSNPGNFMEGYGVSDLAFIYRFKIHKAPVEFSAHAENLLNENYEIVHSFPMPGRSYLLSFQITI
jgi:outer membrane receptor for ferrienterochelin and colicin